MRLCGKDSIAKRDSFKYMIIPALKNIFKKIGTIFCLLKNVNTPFKDSLTELEDEMLYNCESYCGQPCNVTRISTIYYEVNNIL